MKKHFSGQQMSGSLKQAEAGMPGKALCRQHGASAASFYTWRAKYGGMNMPAAKRLNALGAECQASAGFRRYSYLQALKTFEGISRKKKIVQDLKEFAHAGEMEKLMLKNIPNGLNSAINIAWNKLKYKVQFKQELLNILGNAEYAIEGQLTIAVRTGTEGGQAWMEFTDSGRGHGVQNPAAGAASGSGGCVK